MANRIHKKINSYLQSKNSKHKSEINEKTLDTKIQSLSEDSEIMKILNLENVQGICNFKGKTESEEFRTQGNSLYQDKNFEKALIAYNYAVISAPHGHGEQNECLSLAYANRSALLFETEQYETAVEDIERAIKQGYPKNKLVKLIERKVKCYINSNKREKAELIYKQIKTNEKLMKEESYRNLVKNIGEFLQDSGLTKCNNSTQNQMSFFTGLRNSPVLDYLPPEGSFVNDAVLIKHSRGRGRHLIASKDIKPGEILIVERAFCSVLIFDCTFRSYCCVCLRKAFVPLPCHRCSLAVFCSEKCWNDRTIHENECQVLPIAFALKLDEEVTLVLRTISKFKSEELTNYISNNLNSRLKDLEGLNNLEGNINMRSSVILQEAIINSFLVFELLKFVPNLEKLEQSNSIRVKVVGLITRWILGFQCNIHTIKELQVDTNVNIISCQSKNIGYGVYMNFSLMNHSCIPNTLHSSLGDLKYLYSISSISRGEEILDSYGERYVTHDKQSRIKSLKQTYYFDCDCQACLKDFPLYANLPMTFNMVCLKCKRNLARESPICKTCYIIYDKLNPKNSNQAPPYDLKTIQNKLSNEWNDYNDAYANLASFNIANKDIKKISRLISSFEKYTKVPHIPLVESQEALLRTYDLLGSFIFINGK